MLASTSPRRRLSRFSVPGFPDLPDGDDPVSTAVFLLVGVPLLVLLTPLWLAELFALLLDLLLVVALAPLRLAARLALLGQRREDTAAPS